ncbi:two-component system cell cycle response regulator [Anaerosolibacter carboniphilus]|uniref:Stage 0 sporulation protein A homolog n=1 Tax=Anaerosolibacter carboniphilus TaxID=1417629 RepID=A0A841L1Q2_9FIRM|nr:diguanylate cyclase [Anaerosolibacter carboniphilus]MBB6218548.1 two-component system cell cycle response regulator [Anaerosolibacter carboniphilus]
MFSVLHVDSNSFYTEIVKDLIAKNSIQYLTARNIKEAFQTLENNKVDLIITGLEFTDGTGDAFILSLYKSDYKKIPIIVLSSRDDLSIKTTLFELGVIDFIPKSLFIERFIPYLNNITLLDSFHKTLQNISIAVLDDNELQIRVIKDIFESYQIKNVDYYLHPHELLSSNKQYGLYLIDFILPNISGERVIWEIRSENKYALIIGISSIDNEKIISQILMSGADDYISKPINKDIFFARLNANLRTYRLLQKLKQKNLELEEMAKLDSLTRLYNHRYIYERLEEEIQRAKRYKHDLSIIMFDIDNFKQVNDIYGHPTGDEVIVKVSSTLKNICRSTDILGRYGGEEFLILLPETGLADGIKLAERLRTQIADLTYSQESLKVTISGGVATLGNQGALELVKKVDNLLYEAKNSGRNKIVY